MSAWPLACSAITVCSPIPSKEGDPVNVALGVLFLWLGGACLWVAFHGTEASTPWDAFSSVTGALNAQTDSA